MGLNTVILFKEREDLSTLEMELYAAQHRGIVYEKDPQARHGCNLVDAYGGAKQ